MSFTLLCSGNEMSDSRQKIMVNPNSLATIHAVWCVISALGCHALYKSTRTYAQRSWFGLLRSVKRVWYHFATSICVAFQIRRENRLKNEGNCNGLWNKKRFGLDWRFKWIHPDNHHITSPLALVHKTIEKRIEFTKWFHCLSHHNCSFRIGCPEL